MTQTSAISDPLAKLLADSHLISAEQLDAALQRQVIFGGNLETILLEDDILDEPTLLRALHDAFGLPVATPQDIDAIAPHMPRLFPLLFAETYHLVPYSLEQQNFGVLLSRPPDDNLRQSIHERLQLTLKPVLTTEARLHFAMHRLYGTELLPRFRALLHKLDGAAPSPDRDSQQSEHVLSWGISAAHISPTRSRREGNNAGALDVQSLLGQLDAAEDRDSVVEVLLGATLATFEFTALFLLQDGVVRGWRGTNPNATQLIARVSLPLELPSVFKTVRDTGAHSLGQLQQSAGNQKFLNALQRAAPRTAFVAPIHLGERLAVLLYADNGARGIPSRRVSDILLLAHRAGRAFERLIQNRKAAAQRLLTESGQSDRAAPAQAAPGAESHPDADAAASAAGLAQPLPQATMPAETELAAAQHVRTPASHAVPSARDAAENAEQPPPALEEHDIVVEAEPAPAAAAGDDVAFAELDESPEEALDDWEDVLVETVSAGASEAAPSSQPTPRAEHPSVSWDTVLAEADRAATTEPAAPESIEVAGTLVDERDLLFDNLEASDPQARKHAVEKLAALGNELDTTLQERFPGAVNFDPLSMEVQLPPFGAINGLTQLLARRGVDAAAVVLPHLESNDPVKRFFAIYYLLAVYYPQAVRALARRLYDSEPRNRYLAADTLRVYAREAEYRHIVQQLREQLRVPSIETQVTTVQVLGQLREPGAVPSLIPLVNARDGQLSHAATSALAVICGQNFGRDMQLWAQWWQGHYAQPRIAWLIESLRHPSLGMQKLAHDELQLATGRSAHFDPNADPEQKEHVIAAWEQWWQRVSQAPPASTPSA